MITASPTCLTSLASVVSVSNDVENPYFCSVCRVVATIFSSVAYLLPFPALSSMTMGISACILAKSWLNSFSSCRWASLACSSASFSSFSTSKLGSLANSSIFSAITCPKSFAELGAICTSFDFSTTAKFVMFSILKNLVKCVLIE